jgi:DNA (cytosine-5)-methyltransferase 1
MPEFSKINCLDLFSGCGGLSYGFHKEGFNIITCNELEKPISETYKHNYPDTNVIVGDITSKKIKEELYNQFTDINCDIVLGGPPCVAYSMSGLRNSRDPRGQLFKDYVEVVNKLKPKVFIMENVKGILSILHDKPKLNKEEKKIADKYYKLEGKKLEYESQKKVEKDEKKKKVIINKLNKVKKDIKKMNKDLHKFRMNVTELISDSFSELGYNVKIKLLNAANFGVPQKRERVIFIGIRKDINKEITYPEETHNEKGDNDKQKWVSVKESIEDLEDLEEDTDFNQIYTNHKPEIIERIKNTNIGESLNKKYKEAFFKCYPDQPSNTVKENHGGVFLHYKKNRVMTPRELARLQSFPDNFIFKGSKSNILIQLGNAVPCKLSQVIAKEIKKIFI